MRGARLSAIRRPTDPEGNAAEVYIDTPYCVAQPHSDPLDLDKSDEELMHETEASCRANPSFMPIDDWQARFAQRVPRACAPHR